MTLTTPNSGITMLRVPRTSDSASIEWPTALLVAGVYSGWLFVSFMYGRWPLWVVAPLMAVLLTLHSSTQHEILHGHPTKWRSLNRFLGLIPLSLWLPYERYRQTHLVHHVDERLTDPLDDPESYYWTPEDWACLDPVCRTLVWMQTTLLGRMIIGPLWIIPRFWMAEFGRVLRNQGKARYIWTEHLLLCIPVVLWITLVCGMPLWLYVGTMVLPGMSILLIRSFAEHRARPNTRERIAIVENSWILGPLFLYNNLHAVHHEAPTIPWYGYNAYYRENRDRIVRENGGLVYNTYFDVARRFLLRPHDVPRHPMGRITGV